MLSYGLGREKPKHSKDIARITFDVYKQNPRDLFGSLNVKATFYGLYSMSCDFQGVGPKKSSKGAPSLDFLTAARHGSYAAGNFIYPSPHSRGG